MVFTPEQRDALPMVRSLLAAADRTLGRCYDTGASEDIGDALRQIERAGAFVADVFAGGRGPVVMSEVAPVVQGASPGNAQLDQILGGLIHLAQNCAPAAQQSAGA